MKCIESGGHGGKQSLRTGRSFPLPETSTGRKIERSEGDHAKLSGVYIAVEDAQKDP